jgi:hypothetical protein
MTEDLHDAERALREMFAARAATVPPPIALHAAVLRRARRFHRFRLFGAIAGVIAVATAVPAGLAVSGGPGPAPLPPGPAALPAPVCTAPARTPVDGPRFPEQRDVRGSLGGDLAAVDAVLRAGWAGMTPRRPAAGSLRVLFIERVDGRIGAYVAARTARTGEVVQVGVDGPDLGHLSARPVGSWAGWSDVSEDQPVGGLVVCGRNYAVLFAAPGSEATLNGVYGLGPDAKPVVMTRPVPMRPDGLGMLPVFDRRVTATVRTSAGVVVQDRPVTVYADAAPLPPVADLDAAVRGRDVGATPVDQVRVFARVAVERIMSGSMLPVLDLRTLWLQDTGDGLAGAFAWTVPGGAGYVSLVKETGPGGGIIGGVSGQPVTGAGPDDVAVAFRQDDPGASLLLIAPRAARAEIDTDGGSRSVPLVQGGALVRGEVVRYRLYDAAGRLIGEHSPTDGWLSDPF